MRETECIETNLLAQSSWSQLPAACGHAAATTTQPAVAVAQAAGAAQAAEVAQAPLKAVAVAIWLAPLGKRPPALVGKRPPADKAATALATQAAAAIRSARPAMGTAKA